MIAQIICYYGAAEAKEDGSIVLLMIDRELPLFTDIPVIGYTVETITSEDGEKTVEVPLLLLEGFGWIPRACCIIKSGDTKGGASPHGIEES